MTIKERYYHDNNVNYIVYVLITTCQYLLNNLKNEIKVDSEDVMEDHYRSSGNCLKILVIMFILERQTYKSF